MCYVCCKELKGWCKSFTRTESLLSFLEAILLVVLISFLVFLILHFCACRKNLESVIEESPKKTSSPGSVTGKSTEDLAVISPSTFPPDLECTWEPSRKTTAKRHYYLTDINYSRKESRSTSFRVSTDKLTTTESLEVFGQTLQPSYEYEYDIDFLEPPDGELAEDKYKSQVVALVKLKPAGDVTFGCILTKITKFWTLTAASCIESIEEVDSLDSFVIMEEWGEAQQSRPRGVADVRLHPRRGGDAAARRSHDLAALRTDRALRGRTPLLRLPNIIDYFLIAIGERFLILGYGGYRTGAGGSAARRLRQVWVHGVAAAQCGGGAARHLAGGAARGVPHAARGVPHAACGAAPLCVAARYSRGTPCHYCGGAPLLSADSHTLLGIMSDNTACGLTCEPQLYVNIATLRDWIDSIIR